MDKLEGLTNEAKINETDKSFKLPYSNSKHPS